jgi:hypothetical protein
MEFARDVIVTPPMNSVKARMKVKVHLLWKGIWVKVLIKLLMESSRVVWRRSRLRRSELYLLLLGSISVLVFVWLGFV